MVTILISRYIKTKWNSINRKKLIEFGYKFTNWKDELIIKIEHASTGSRYNVLVKCDYCGRIFKQSYSAYNGVKYKGFKDSCSIKCTQLKIEENNTKKYGVKNTYQLVDRVKAGNIKKFGVEHHFKLESKKLYGAKNPAYNPNIKHVKLDILNYKRLYNNWRMSVFARDKFQCQKCKTVSARFNAHHILSKSDNVDKIFDIDNGITLCKECHKLFHDTYGYGKNNKIQFDEFMDITNRSVQTTGDEYSQVG